MLNNKLARIAAGAAVFVALLAGCSGNDGGGHGNMPGMGESSKTTAAKQREANQADIAFAQQMIVHHQQAIEMAKLAPSRASDERVVELANQIEQAQAPEIQTMTGWLREWGAPMPDGGMDHVQVGGGDMSGMISDKDIAQLRKANGAEFDRMFMNMMIKHHQGAIEAAKAELRNGSHTGAKRVAQAIVDTQKAEIDTMKRLLMQS